MCGVEAPRQNGIKVVFPSDFERDSENVFYFRHSYNQNSQSELVWGIYFFFSFLPSHL